VCIRIYIYIRKIRVLWLWPVKPNERTDELMCLAKGGAKSSDRHLMTKMVQLLCNRHYQVRTLVIKFWKWLIVQAIKPVTVHSNVVTTDTGREVTNSK
jgi:hypothetical protein